MNGPFFTGIDRVFRADRLAPLRPYPPYSEESEMAAAGGAAISLCSGVILFRFHQNFSQLVITAYGRDIRMITTDVIRWAKKPTMVGFSEHGDIVIGVAGGYNGVIHRLETTDCMPFRVGLANVVTGDFAFPING